MMKETSPKQLTWHIRHGSGHCIVSSPKGLTAFEAWQRSKLPGNPPFHVVDMWPGTAMGRNEPSRNGSNISADYLASRIVWFGTFVRSFLP